MSDDPRQQQIRALIQMGAKEFTGGDVAAFLRLARADTPDPLPERLVSELNFEPPETSHTPKSAELWAKAQQAGFADIMADVRQADGKEGETISDIQAFFCGWYHLYYRPNGREILKQASLPHTITGIAAYLNRSRVILYKWTGAEWFRAIGVQAWLNTRIMGMIPAALSRLELNITDGNGAVSNQAIKLVVDEARAMGRGQQDAGNIFNGELLPKVSIYLPDNGR